VSSAAAGQTPTSIVRRIRELAPQASAGHVSGQHVVSKVILSRFAGVSGPGAGLLYPFRLRYPDARHRLLGPDGCGKVPDFISYASGSAERLWNQTEDRLHDPWPHSITEPCPLAHCTRRPSRTRSRCTTRAVPRPASCTSAPSCRSMWRAAPGGAEDRRRSRHAGSGHCGSTAEANFPNNSCRA
jgi:hypothetical protein